MCKYDCDIFVINAHSEKRCTSWQLLHKVTKWASSLEVTCLYGKHVTLRAVAHEVGGNNIDFVAGAALQATDHTQHIQGVAAMNDPIAVLCHCNIEKCCVAHLPLHRDGVFCTISLCWDVLGSAWGWGRKQAS